MNIFSAAALKRADSVRADKGAVNAAAGRGYVHGDGASDSGLDGASPLEAESSRGRSRVVRPSSPVRSIRLMTQPVRRKAAQALIAVVALAASLACGRISEDGQRASFVLLA